MFVRVCLCCVCGGMLFVSVCGMGPTLPVNSSSLWTQEVCWGGGEEGDVRVIFMSEAVDRRKRSPNSSTLSKSRLEKP